MSTSTEIPALNLEKNLVEWERATSLIPGGALGIRRPYNFVEGEFPIFIDHGQGGQIVDVDGNTFTDFLCAYGPIILGYREQEVDEAVISRIREKGFCFSLTQVLQNELAEVLRDIIPCAQMSLFVKTGSDATSVAVRLARAFTQRTGIIRCGYHGWHDWCVEVKGGIPAKLYEDVREFPYNDLDALESLLKQHGEDTAAIILTPYGHPLAAPMEDPAPGFLEGAKKLAHCYGALLIFDEIRTGFRLALGGAQERFGVTPDVAVFGKAMANGYAIAAV
ncbi:MAG: aminotransferase class III-fold pyridoxal phosphate-dependent enzyme, partial [Spirochaetales bacterium]|nr:aminotransferase class III-fold pyridoxal phosphate-dependent enzyme [Spirochaetales bacterium]